MANIRSPYEGKFELPENPEEEAIIEKISQYKRSILKLFFYYLFSVATCGLVALFEKWKFSVRVLFKYSVAISKESEFLIIVGNGTYLIWPV